MAASPSKYFVVATVGSHGDVFPFVALGAALTRLGHRVTLAANESYESTAHRMGMGFEALATDAEVDQLLSDPNAWSATRCGLVGARWTRSTLQRQFATLDSLVGDDDTLVAPPSTLAARLIQETRGVSLATIYYTPWMLASSHLPPAMTSGYTLPAGAPKWLGHAYWLSVDLVGWILIGRALNRLRNELGLKPVRRLFRWWTSPDLAVGLFPEWFAPRQPDWPSQLRLANFPAFQGSQGATEEAIAFCKSAEPPVLVTFGTEMRFAKPLLESIVTQLLRAERRGLILCRDARQVPKLAPGVKHFDYACLNEVLPHCHSMVHHGGVGTVAAGLRTATPQIIVPLAWDQLDNANRVQRLQAGYHLPRKHIPRRLLSLLSDVEQMRTGLATYMAGRNATSDLETAAQWIVTLANNKHTTT